MSGYISSNYINVYLNNEAKYLCIISTLNSEEKSVVLRFKIIWPDLAYHILHTMVGTLIVATIYLQLIQNRYMFRSFTVLHCSHQHCVQPVASDVEVVGYL